MIRTVLDRLLWMVLGTLIALALLEGALRVGSLLHRGRAAESRLGARETLLCVGDSHTYGVLCRAEDAYPGQLQAILDDRAPRRYRVVNLGLPGMSSTQVVSSLPGWIEKHGATRVLFCAGMNNLWNTAEGRADLGRGELRVIRLFRFLSERVREAHDAGAGRPRIRRVLINEGRRGVEHRDHATGELLVRHQGDINRRLPLDGVTARLRRDLEQARRLCASRGVVLYLVTYASEEWERATGHRGPSAAINDELASFARQSGVPIIDVCPSFRRVTTASPHSVPPLFLWGDSHPSPRGYALLARTVADMIHSEARAPDG